MKGLKDKFRLIYIPFLLIAIVFIIVYTFLNWLLFIKLELFSLKEDVVNLWLPMALPLIPVLIWLRPRIKLLEFKKENGSFGFQVLAVLAMLAPTIIAQQYLQTATGKLTPLESISQLEKKAPTRYYTLQHYFIDKTHIGVQGAATVSGKRNQDLNYALYVALPILDNEADTAKGAVAYWLCKKYRRTISNKLSEEEKDKQYNFFMREAQSEFDTAAFENFAYLEKMGNTEDHDQFNEAIKKSGLAGDQKAIAFAAETDAFANRSDSKLGWIFLSLGLGCVLYFVFLLFVPFREGAVDEFKAGVRTKDSDTREMLSLFIPRKGFLATPLIIDINILVYIIMVISGLGFISFSAADLLHWGGNFRPSTANGEYWRLVTSVFLHGGLLHLVANMAGLLFAGVFLEHILGTAKYALAYLLSGIVGSCASLWWHPATVSVGASGAIFGIYGLLLALLLLKAIPRELSKAFMGTTLVFVGYNLLMGLLGEGIDNAAHIGGLLSGFIIGIIMAGSVKKEGAMSGAANP